MQHLHSIYNVIIGTAGHIDHGKSRLVERLTGIDPDRLAEEKRRGMTIDLGFAPYVDRHDRLVGIIDVPGHERFVKNMVAGATSVDIMLLVVAADDGVMPQTREHLQIMDVLGIRRGMTVVTKRDLVEPEMLELAVEDVREATAGTFLEKQPLHAVSSVTGEGLDDLVDSLEALIEETPARRDDGLFRMPIQRVFTAPGHGTVVTGVPFSGQVKTGDVVEIVPGGLRGRVRAIQAYKEPWERARAGHSTALNIADVDYRAVRRGMTVAIPGYFSESVIYEVRIQGLPLMDRPLRVREAVRFHVGTAEAMGELRLLDRETLEAGQSALAQVVLEEGAVAAPGDRFLVRRPSPMTTLGGGMIIGSSAKRLKRRPSVIEAVSRREQALGDPVRSLEVALERSGVSGASVKDLAAEIKQEPDWVARELKSLAERGGARVVQRGAGLWIHAGLFSQAVDRVVAAVEAIHERHPLRKWVETRTLRPATGLAEAILNEVIVQGVADGLLAVDRGGKVRASGFTPRLSEEQEEQVDMLRALYATADVNPPSLADAAARVGVDLTEAGRLVDLLAEEGELVRVGELLFHHLAIDRARRTLVDLARAAGGEVVIPRLRDELGTSRKYMIPLLEYFDAEGVTRRRGDKRTVHPSSA